MCPHRRSRSYCPALGSLPASSCLRCGPSSTSPGHLQRWKCTKPISGKLDAMRNRLHCRSALVLVMAMLGTTAVCDESAFVSVHVDPDAGSATALYHWLIQSSAK